MKIWPCLCELAPSTVNQQRAHMARGLPHTFTHTCARTLVQMNLHRALCRQTQRGFVRAVMGCHWISHTSKYAVWECYCIMFQLLQIAQQQTKHHVRICRCPLAEDAINVLLLLLSPFHLWKFFLADVENVNLIEALESPVAGASGGESFSSAES